MIAKFPDTFTEARAGFPWPSLWLRGLPHKQEIVYPRVDSQYLGVRVEGIFLDQTLLRTAGLVFATDASGGRAAVTRVFSSRVGP